MVIKTRVFELTNGKYHNLSHLAKAMGLSASYVYRIRKGERSINEKFIIGAKKAFPDYSLDELFYFNTGPSEGYVSRTTVNTRYRYIVQQLAGYQM